MRWRSRRAFWNTTLLLKSMGEPPRHREPVKSHGALQALVAYFRPLIEFLERQGAVVVLAFVLVHKIGDTLANLTLRLLFADLGFTNDEIASYDVGVGFVALLIGIFIGGIAYARLGMKRSVLISLVLMAVSNFSFAALAAAGHTNLGMAAAIGFENFASGMGGVTVVAYLSALCNLRFTATQYALLSALASIAGRFITGTTVGALIESIAPWRSIRKKSAEKAKPGRKRGVITPPMSHWSAFSGRRFGLPVASPE
jgi:PAT family beta-lactamase induction signal transducer AmpG